LTRKRHTEAEPDIFDIQANFCAIFSNSNRLRILAILGKEEKTVSQIAEELGTTLSHVSQHLRIMKDRGIVAFCKEGRESFYWITNDNFLKGSALIRKGLIELHSKSGLALSKSTITRKNRT